ncbi:organic hydroperoxide resistance protein [Thioclava dalianensis]|uniref:Organic hydroperoxide resistance protein n=1 Tax=Thioclava dalianensis TaxID=1185766 RepID=A0A074UAD5_9RHOB|nr:organic hydroperoxide resistance protein [Thioclava dalianensis]KEP71662.1 organic hydroperoxide resistance protein [Thioclava dalianensis]SFN41749.1 peroxiredoxin, Ohr subfamily [Thioclava dalianensis]
MKPTKIAYSTKATATGGRDGRATTQDGALDLTLVTPKELGGAGGDGVNPEQLFAAGYAACFLSALNFLAAQKKQKLPESTHVSTTVGIGPTAEKGFALDVQIEVSLPGLDREIAQELIDGAHKVCPYSDATRNSLEITPTLA